MEKNLRRAALPYKGVGNGSLAGFPVRVLQFGEGNFLRAFADWMFDALNSKGLFNGSVLALNNTRRGSVEKLKAQDCLYTLVVRGLRDGRSVDEPHILTSISQALNPYAEWPALLKLMASRDLRYAVSNATEAGIVYAAEPFKQGQAQESFPAKCAALLAARAKAFDFVPGEGRLLFLPCELIEANGDALRAAVLRHLSDWNFEREAVWVSKSCVFANTLVDRIVPGAPSPEERKLLEASLGYEDSALVVAEPFHFWAIEAPESEWDSIPFAKGGLNVVWTKSVKPYRERKVRLLNAAHTANVFSAFLAGCDTVREMMEHPLFGKIARKALYDELLPTIALPDAEKRAYADTVVERFLNPFVRHELLSISLNSVSKWKVRVLPPLLETLSEGLELPGCLSFSLAALSFFYRGELDASGAFIKGTRAKGGYSVKDSPETLKAFSEAWRLSGSDARAFAGRVLPDLALWGVDLSEVPGLRARFENDLERMLRDGVERAAGTLLGD